MKTLLTEDPAAAAALVQGGALVAFPTETVYGLGADAFNADSVAAIFHVKERPADNPLIVHIACHDQLADIAASIPRSGQTLIDRFFPGPLTVIVRRHTSLPPAVTAGLDSVAVRMPSHPIARRFLNACQCPVAAPSANHSGRPSATTWEAVRDDLGGRIDAILRGPPSEQGIESTVVDCSQEIPVLLRPGATSAEELVAVLPSLRVPRLAESLPARSPGLRHRHYAPRASVVLIKDPKEAQPHAAHAFIGTGAVQDPSGFGRCHIASDVKEYARVLFDFFRQCEAADIRTVYCQEVIGSGVGRAVMDRLRRAAAK